MENGNYNGSEFGWDYSHGGQGQGGMSNYSQMGQMNQGGRQWLHSNQNHSFHQAGMSQGQQGSFASPQDPFADFNNSMMSRYGSYNPSGGKADMYGSMMQDGGHEMDFDMSNGMGGGGANVSPRMSGGYSGGSRNGLGDPSAGRGHNNGTSWF
ncbi:keratin, type II cytoskeletal 1 isoform X1 [Drosophila guanche]|uniref:Uncharacterized protein n=1 Tax=Drosophila guanche TaxID=7266 RepID=A0A3B0K3A8_DROGU|nr:keratin, type II cytoskeletal 1 isoform X1 [Drosophila guanche]SPP79511.1 Hypothetical predicted protein [Drosophila guanche]